MILNTHTCGARIEVGEEFRRGHYRSRFVDPGMREEITRCPNCRAVLHEALIAGDLTPQLTALALASRPWSAC